MKSYSLTHRLIVTILLIELLCRPLHIGCGVAL